MARILIVGINYAPEDIGTGKYTGEMATWLAANGHSVRVVTAPPYYPSWKISNGYRRWWWSREWISGAEVLRCPIWVPAKPRGLTRLLHLASFGLTCIPALAASLFFRAEVVVNVAPTMASAPAAWLYAKVTGAKTWLHIQDFELDAALEMGVIRANTGRKLAFAIELAIMRRFDRVSTISDMMIARLSTKGVEARSRTLFPNWVDIGAIRPLSDSSPYRRLLNISDSAVVALYSGNMGLKQGLEILEQVARSLKDMQQLHFVFGGQGPGRSLLEQSCADLPNVHFLELQPIDKLNDWLGLADIHLLPQRADVADLVMPSKLTGMLASGRTVVATAAHGTGVAKALAQSGVVVPPGDAHAMASAIRELCSQPDRRRVLGAAARHQAEQTLGLDAVLAGFNSNLTSILTPKESSVSTN